MYFERIESKGLSHYSYLLSAGGRAIVIDPRRDCDIYIQKAHKNGFKITNILETHRNEDYVIGSVELANRTGADIWHADSHLNYQYGQPAEEGQSWELGGYKIEAILTPGHTEGSMSYLLYDIKGYPWILFTGDALFAGDTGRVDLLGMDRAQEMAGHLYETIFNKFLPLGDQVIVCPAHGAGSVCGGKDMSKRKFTTIGLERLHNPKLQFTNKKDFVKNAAVEMERPPYFLKMEKYNIEGAPILGEFPKPKLLSPTEFSSIMDSHQILDTRKELDFSSGFIPGALSIWEEGISSFAGWHLNYDKPILLVNQTDNYTDVVKYLIRMGFDDITGYLSGGMFGWHKVGKVSSSIKTIFAQDLKAIIDTEKRDNYHILDVREEEEIHDIGMIAGSSSIHVTILNEKIDKVPKNIPVYIICGSGVRSMIAASLLAKEGRDNIYVLLGGIDAWKSQDYPVI